MIQKKKNTWHKNKTAPKKNTDKTEKRANSAKHWVVSRARLVKILEASGMQPEKPVTMLPRPRDR